MFNLQNFFGFPHPMGPQRFECRLRAYSASFFPSFDQQKLSELNFGGKILLPNSVLDHLIRLHIEYPMMFKLTSMVHQRTTHSGVLEFIAQEGQCYLPDWMMRQLMLGEGEQILIEYAALPKAMYAKFKPMSTDFLNVSNPRAMLEVELRKFACLTKNDVIAVLYNDQTFEFRVQELKPANAVSIIECDMNVEFDAPEGYVEPTTQKKTSEKPPAPDVTPVLTGFQPFSGSGHRLDGKVKPPSSSKLLDQAGTSRSTQAQPIELLPVVINETYIPGSLNFVRYDYKSRACVEREMRDKKADIEKMDSFAGSSFTIRGNR